MVSFFWQLSALVQNALGANNMSLNAGRDAGPSSLGGIGEKDQQAFKGVLAQLRRDQIAQVGLSVHQRLFPDKKTSAPKVVHAICGSFNILFPMQFSSGTRWLLKVPMHGHKESWDDVAAQALIAEATTMRVLQQKTTIPIPKVYDFSATAENPLKCPYILMEYVDGHSLYDVWFANRLKGADDDVVHKHRINALRGIATAMAQLSAYTSSKAGTPIFDADCKLTGVGTLRYMDQHAMLNRWFLNRDPDPSPVFLPVEPFASPSRYYTLPLDIHDKKGDEVARVLRRLAEWLPEPPADQPFVLAHPDFDIQNFIVSENGELMGIIDWDGVAMVPHSDGNLCLPGWLTRDWDPGMYGYNPSMEDGVEPVGVWENSPMELTGYRRIYRRFIAGASQKYPTEDGADATSVSLVAGNLGIAARDPASRGAIVEKTLDEVCRVTKGAFSTGTMDLARQLANGRVDGVVADLKAGFAGLLRQSHEL